MKVRYPYHPAWYFAAAANLSVIVWGSAYAALYEYTFYRNIDPFAGTLIYILLIDVMLLVNPAFIFAGKRIGFWSLAVALFAAFFTFGSFVTNFDILMVASLINIILSVPQSKYQEKQSQSTA